MVQSITFLAQKLQLKVFSAEGEEFNWAANSAMTTFYEASKAKAIWNHRESYQNYLDWIKISQIIWNDIMEKI